mgnify:CR=1 FL=1
MPRAWNNFFRGHEPFNLFQSVLLFVAFEQDSEKKILNDKELKVVTAGFMYLQRQATVRCVGTG